MNEHIRQLSITADAARQRLHAASLFNVHGLDAAARVISSMEYAKAQAEYSNADNALRAAIAQELNKKSQP